jgi:hypothetical protein
MWSRMTLAGSASDRTSNGRIGWLAAIALCLFASPAPAGSIFDSLPHLKKERKSLCHQYGDCFGHYQVTYRPWPPHCVNVYEPARPTQQTLPPPTPPRQTLPKPTPQQTLPAPTPAKPEPGPVPGVLYEIEHEPAPRGGRPGR